MASGTSKATSSPIEELPWVPDGRLNLKRILTEFAAFWKGTASCWPTE
jgi:hypothetical protein